MSSAYTDITGLAPNPEGYKSVRVEFIPGDGVETMPFWAVIGFDQIWNNTPAVRWQYHAHSRGEAEVVADWLRALRSGRATALLTTQEAARLLDVNASRVRQMILAGALHATKHGRDWLIDRADLAAVAERKPGRPKRDQ